MSVSVPSPRLTIVPVPLISLAKVGSSLRAKTSVPSLTRLPTKSPVLAPRPICSVPPPFKPIDPRLPRESVPPICTTPAVEMASEPVPSSEPTTRSPVVVQVPPVTRAVAVPNVPGPARLAEPVVSVPPEMARPPVPPSKPSTRFPWLIQVPPWSVALPVPLTWSPT